MRRLFYGLLALLNGLLLIYGFVTMAIGLAQDADLRWAMGLTFGLTGIFVLLLLWPGSKHLARLHAVGCHLTGGSLILAALTGMGWMIVRPAVYTTLEILGGWLVLFLGLMIAALPWLLRAEPPPRQKA